MTSQCDCFAVGPYQCLEHGQENRIKRARDQEYEYHSAIAALRILKPVQWGFLFRWRSAWVGLHYSISCKRYCLNLLPCCTIWWTQPGGDPPDSRKM